MTLKDAVYYILEKLRPKERTLTFDIVAGNVENVSLTIKERAGFCAVKLSFRNKATVTGPSDVLRLANLSEDVVGSMCGFLNSSQLLVFVRSNALILRATGSEPVLPGEIFIRGVLSMGGAP